MCSKSSHNINNIKEIKIRAIQKETGKVREEIIKNDNDFERVRVWAFENGFDCFTTHAQGGYQWGYPTDFDPNDRSLGEAYRREINYVNIHSDYEILRIFSGGGFQDLRLTSPFNYTDEIGTYHRSVIDKFGVDVKFRIRDDNLRRCPFTFNHKRNRWAIPIQPYEKLRSILKRSKSKPAVDWNFLLKWTYGDPNCTLPVIPKNSPNGALQSDPGKAIDKATWLYLLDREDWPHNESGTAVKCPKAEHHKGREEGHLSASLLRMRDGVVRLYCHRHGPLDVFNFYFYAHGLKYPEASRKLVEIIQEMQSIKKVVGAK
jgi:hypothetical protein